MKLAHAQKALRDFVHPYFQQYIDEFLIGNSESYPEDQPPFYQLGLDQKEDLRDDEVVQEFANYCLSCGYWEV